MGEDEKKSAPEGEEQRKLKKNKKKSKAAKIIVITLAVVFVIMLLVVVAGVLVINHYLGMMEYVDPANTDDIISPEEAATMTDWEDEPALPPVEGGETGTTAPETEVEWPDIEDLPTFDDGELINIMIVGQDRREGMGRMHSDTMILVSVNPETYDVSLISFLRDTWVPIPGYWDERLNVAYFYGGFPLMKDAIKQNFGVEIDGCFEVDFYDFMDIIELLGGVEIDVTQAESDHMKSFMKVDVPAGHVRLNGEQALAYSRIRKIDSDFQRTERQRKILLSLFNEFKSASLSELKGMADLIMPKLATDMTVAERWGLLMKFLPALGKMKIKTYSVPTFDDFRRTFIDGKDVLVPDLYKIRDRLANQYLPF